MDKRTRKPKVNRSLGWILAAVTAGLALSCADGGGESGGRSVCSLASASPATGDPAGGEQVLLTGSGFVAGMQAVFGTGLSPSVVVLDPNSAMVETPPSAIAAVVDVAVILPSGRTCVLRGGYTYNGPCIGGCPGCALGAVAPAEGPLAGGSTIWILGNGFLAGAEVVFGTQLSPDVTVIDWFEIRAVTPPSPIAGTVDVTVLKPSGTICRLPDGYVYGEGCAVTSVQPNVICPYVPERLTIMGNGFQDGAIVSLGSVTLVRVQVLDPWTIEAYTPEQGIGPVLGASLPVGVTNPDGRTCMLPDAVSWSIPPPTPPCTVAGISPDTGPVAGGQRIVISGTGFAATDRVFFGLFEVAAVTLLPGGALEVISPPADNIGGAFVRVVDTDCSRQPCLDFYTYQ
ncbi:MAG: IPT/TIG domain-containing protein [Planctomycetota bacterium]|nr:IPT/TIG domain-containing protein [Planctomycetota bacterium]